MDSKIKELRIIGAAYEMALNCDYVPDSVSEAEEIYNESSSDYTIEEYKLAVQKYANNSGAGLESIVFRIISKLQ